MAVIAPGTSMPESGVGLQIREIPRPPKTAAVKALAEKLSSRGFDDQAAAVLARTPVDPADVRRRLERPTPIRVPGAVLWTVETDVWAPTVVPYVVNYREAAERVFPADSTVPDDLAPEYPPIRRPSSDLEGRPALDVRVDSPEHLVHAVEASVNYLLQHNPLGESIEEKGVMFPITLVMTAVDVGEGDPIHLPATADGSSRTAGALDVLGVAPEDVVGRFRTQPRELSGLVGRVRSIFDRPADQVSEAELGHANALILPARMIIGFDPDPAGTADFAKAVHNYVQLVHGDLPPKEWSPTAKVDAKADSVVAELERADLITPNKALYLEGMLDPEEAEKLGFPANVDERGLVIASLISKKKAAINSAIRAGIVQASDQSKVTKKAKSEICAELALRGARGELPSSKDVAKAREVLGSVYGNASIWEAGLEPSGKDPGQLLAEALEERKTGRGGTATAELGALGGFWLVVHRILREARFFKEENFSDSRNPSSILTELMDSEWGLRVLAQAIADGRGGEGVRQVDSEGATAPSVDDEVRAHHAWLRGTVVPPEHLDGKGGNEGAEDDGRPPLRERILLDHRKKLEAAVALVEQRHGELRGVEGVDGESLVERRGLPPSTADELRERLEVVARALVVYSARWAEVSEPDGMEPSP